MKELGWVVAVLVIWWMLAPSEVGQAVGDVVKAYRSALQETGQ